MNNLEIHADRELRRAGLFDKDSDYNGMIGPAIMKMIRVFAAEGHSGMSAAWCLQIFGRLASFKNLTPLTNDPEEWHDVSGMSEKPMWQSIRSPNCFSEDGGKHYYDIDDKDRIVKETAGKQ